MMVVEKVTLTKQQLSQYLVPDVSAAQKLFGDSYHRRFKRVGKKLHRKLNTCFADTIRPNYTSEFVRKDDLSALLKLADLLATGQMYDINFMILRSAYDTLPAAFPSDVPAFDIAIMHQLRDVFLPRKYQTLGEGIYRILNGAMGRKLKLDHDPNRPVINQLITHMVLLHIIQQIKPGIYEVNVEETAVRNITDSLIDNLLYDLIMAVTLPQKVLEMLGLHDMLSIVIPLRQLFQQKVYRVNEAGLISLMERVRVIQEAASKQYEEASEPAEELEWILTISRQLEATADYVIDPSRPVPQPLFRYLVFMTGAVLFLKEQSSQHVPWVERRYKPFKKWQNQIDAYVNNCFCQFLSLYVLEEQRKGLLSDVTQIYFAN